MKLYINSKLEDIPKEVLTVDNLLDYLHVQKEGTGVGVNNQLIKSADRITTYLKEGDNVLIIKATYGG